MPKSQKAISNARLPSHGSSKQNLGNSRCDEYGAALARSGQADQAKALDLKEGKALLDELAR